jgi:hypothetical protein
MGVAGSERFPLTPFIQPKMPNELVRRLWSMLWEVEGRLEVEVDACKEAMAILFDSVKERGRVFEPSW